MSALLVSLRLGGLRMTASAPRWLGPAAVFFAAFLLFTPSLGAYFAVLDFNHLDAIRFTKAGTFFLRIFDPSDGGRNIIGTGELYRPVYYSVYWLEHRAFGYHPLPYYTFNAALHATNAVLVWLLAWRLTRSQLASTAGALIWAFHPQYADTVAWISSTTDLLLVFFALSAVLLYATALDASSGRRWACFGASFAAALLALGAKESGIAVVPIIAGYHLLFHTPKRLDWRALPWTLLPFLLIPLLYLPLRAALVGNLAEQGDRSLFSWQAISNIHVLSGLAAGPLAGQKVSNSHFGVGQGAAGMLIIAGTIVAVVLGSRREWFFAGWYYVCLVPYLPLPPIWLVGRYLYLPNIGLAVLAGIGIAKAIELLPEDKVNVYGKQLAAGTLLAGIAIWFAVLNTGYQDWLTAKGDAAGTFLSDLQATYPTIPADSRLIVTDYPLTLSLTPDDGFMLKPAIRLTYDREVTVITKAQLDRGAVPPANDRDLWYPPR
jgi:hypothetical protein